MWLQRWTHNLCKQCQEGLDINPEYSVRKLVYISIHKHTCSKDKKMFCCTHTCIQLYSCFCSTHVGIIDVICGSPTSLLPFLPLPLPLPVSSMPLPPPLPPLPLPLPLLSIPLPPLPPLPSLEELPPPLSKTLVF